MSAPLRIKNNYAITSTGLIQVDTAAGTPLNYVITDLCIGLGVVLPNSGTGYNWLAQLLFQDLSLDQTSFQTLQIQNSVSTSGVEQVLNSFLTRTFSSAMIAPAACNIFLNTTVFNRISSLTLNIDLTGFIILS